MRKQRSLLSCCFSSKNKETDIRSNNEKKGKDNWRHAESKSFGPFFRSPSSIEKILGEADQLNIQPQVSLESLKITKKTAAPKSVSPKAVTPRKSDPYPLNALHEAFTAGSSDGNPSSSGTEGKVESSHLKSPVSTVSQQTCDQSDLYPDHTLHEAFLDVSSNVGDPSSNERVEIIHLNRPAPNLTPVTSDQSDLYPIHTLNDHFPAASSDIGGSTGKESEVGASYVTAVRDESASALMIQAAFRGYLARQSFRDMKCLLRLQSVMGGQKVKQQTMNTMKQMHLLVRVQTQIRSQRMQMKIRDEASGLSKRSLKQLSPCSSRNDYWDTSLLTKEEEEARLQKKHEAVIKRDRAMAYAYSHQQQRKSNSRMAQSQFDADLWSWSWFDRLVAAESSGGKSVVKSITSTPQRTSWEYKSSPRLHSKGSKQRSYDTIKDDESLTSCPSFMSPHYMTPTMSATAKIRTNRSHNENFPGTPNSERRFSFPLTPNHGSFKDSGSQTGRQGGSPLSIRSSGLSSRVSTPVGRKPFNRF